MTTLCIYIDMSEEFYDSASAEAMADAYARQAEQSLLRVEELLVEAGLTQRKIEATHKILLRRRRVKLELRLQRILLAILVVLEPENQELGRQIYERLLSCVDRLEKLC